MQHSTKKMRNIVAGSLVAVLASFGAVGTAGADVANAEPGVPAPSLPEIDPTAPPLPGGGG